MHWLKSCLGVGFVCVDALRYMSLHDNTFIRYFRGHTGRYVRVCVCSVDCALNGADAVCGRAGRVVSLDINPVNDQVISGAEDQTVRLWDTRSPHCQVSCEDKAGTGREGEGTWGVGKGAASARRRPHHMSRVLEPCRSCIRALSMLGARRVWRSIRTASSLPLRRTPPPSVCTTRPTLTRSVTSPPRPARR